MDAMVRELNIDEIAAVSGGNPLSLATRQIGRALLDGALYQAANNFAEGAANDARAAIDAAAEAARDIGGAVVNNAMGHVYTQVSINVASGHGGGRNGTVTITKVN